MNLLQAFGIRKNDLVALVGGGGKTSLLFALGQEWPGRVILTTTTRLFVAQTRRAPAHLTIDESNRLPSVLAAHRSCLVTGTAVSEGDKIEGVPADRPAAWLADQLADLVVVEADGARLRPVKAPAAHEPSMPDQATLVIIVAGCDALGRPLEDVVHRPPRAAELTGLQPADLLTPAALVRLLTHPEGGLKKVPAGARVAVCLNKVEGHERHRAATETVRLLMTTGAVERVALTSLQPRVVVYEYPGKGGYPGNWQFPG